MDMLKRLARVRIVDREAGTVEVEVPIPPVGLAPMLQKLLRTAARRDVVVPPVLATERRALAGVTSGDHLTDDAHRKPSTADSRGSE